MTLCRRNQVAYIDVVSEEERALHVLRTIRDKRIRVIAHNAAYDVAVIENTFGIRLDKVFDTMLASQLLALGDAKQRHGLDVLAQQYIDPLAYSAQGSLFEPTVTKKERENITYPISTSLLYYALIDAFYTYRLYTLFLPKLQQKGLIRAAVLENELVPHIVAMTKRGIPFNASTWLQRYERDKQQLTAIEQQLKTYADINWNSPKQVGKFFGMSSVSKTALQAKRNDPVVALYLSYKKAVKAVTSYGPNFLQYVDDSTNCIHYKVFQILETGRMATSSPNVQNIPPAFRDAFEAPEGYVFVNADYSQMELRIIAAISQDPAMLRMLAANDLHTATAETIFGVKEVTKEQRQIAKAANFALSYGGSPDTLVVRYDIKPKKAQEIYKRYFETFSVLKAYYDTLLKRVEEQGYILIDSYSRRKVYLPEIALMPLLRRYKQNGQLASIKRRAQNFPPQGAGATITKLAIVLFEKAVRQHGINAGIVNVIHDEILAITKEEHAHVTQQLLKQTMEKAARLVIGHVIPADADIKKKWIKS